MKVFTCNFTLAVFFTKITLLVDVDFITDKIDDTHIKTINCMNNNEMGESVFERLRYLILSALMLTVVYFRTVEERWMGCTELWYVVVGGGAIGNFSIY